MTGHNNFPRTVLCWHLLYYVVLNIALVVSLCSFSRSDVWSFIFQSCIFSHARGHPVVVANEVSIYSLSTPDGVRMPMLEFRRMSVLLRHHRRRRRRTKRCERSTTAAGLRQTATMCIVVWPTMSCFADWSKRRHVTLVIIICSPLHGHPGWHYNVTVIVTPGDVTWRSLNANVRYILRCFCLRFVCFFFVFWRLTVSFY